MALASAVVAEEAEASVREALTFLQVTIPKGARAERLPHLKSTIIEQRHGRPITGHSCLSQGGTAEAVQ